MMTIAFLGPDGSGKSTLIERLRGELASLFRGIVCLHFRPALLFPKSQRDNCPSPPARGSARGFFPSVAQQMGWVFEYWLHRALRCGSHGNLVIFDRYYYDVLVDPSRYRYGGPRWLIRVLARAVPSPDICIVLEAPPQLILDRKQEATGDELRRSLPRYRELARQFPNAYLISSARPLETVIADARRIILSHI